MGTVGALKRAVVSTGKKGRSERRRKVEKEK
jgi:hypothetical protein